MTARIPTVALACLGWFALSTSATAQLDCPQWAEGFGVKGISGAVRDFVSLDLGDGERTYVGGSFSAAVDVAANSIVAWDGTHWAALGAGVEGSVFALCGFDAGGGPRLYAGGLFDTAGGVAVENVARWDGKAWSSFGGVVDEQTAGVRAMVVFDDGSGPALYVGGRFSYAGGFATKGIARWDGSTWSSVDGGVSGEVRALRVHDDGSGPALYAAGYFDTAGGTTVNHVARWDGTSWSGLGGGLSVGHSSDGVFALEVHDDGSGPGLVAGGHFGLGGAKTYVARWDGVEWGPVGTGLIGQVDALAVHDEGAGERLWAGGNFLSDASFLPDALVKRLDGNTWVAPGPLKGGEFASVYALHAKDAANAGGPMLLAGGSFAFVEPVKGVGLAAWTGGQWSSFGGDPQGLPGNPSALTTFDDGSGQALYVAGSFKLTPGGRTKHLVRWTGSEWTEPPGPNPIHGLGEHAIDIDVLEVGGDLRAGMYILTTLSSGGRVHHWNGTTWSPFLEVPGTWDGWPEVMGLFDDGSGGGAHLFVGGGLGGLNYVGIFEWDGSSWSVPAEGVDGLVYAMAVFDDGSGPALYVGGDFFRAGGWTSGVEAWSIARWDGATWSALTDAETGALGVDDSVHALTVFDDGSGPALYVGGNFEEAGGRPASNIARWDGRTWSGLGRGIGSEHFEPVRDLGVFDDGANPLLLVGGIFDLAGGKPARNLAAWDGSSWSEFGGGASGSVVSILQFDRDLWLCGSFNSLGMVASSGIGRWSQSCAGDPATYCTAKLDAQSCTPAMAWRGTPSASSSAPFLVSASDVTSQTNGLFFYGLGGAVAKPFLGGFLCVDSPLVRTPLQWSGGDPPPLNCSGTFELDLNAWIQSGADPALVAGAQVHGQYWYRDPQSLSGSGLSDAIAFTIQP